MLFLISREQSPSAWLPAHSYLPGYAPTGRELRSHRHSPFLLVTRHGRMTVPPGLTSVYTGWSIQSCRLYTCTGACTANIHASANFIVGSGLMKPGSFSIHQSLVIMLLLISYTVLQIFLAHKLYCNVNDGLIVL